MFDYSYWARRGLHRVFKKRFLPSLIYCLDCRHHVQKNHDVKKKIKASPIGYGHDVVSFGRRFPDKRAKQRIAQVPSIRLFLPKKKISLPANFDLRNVNGVDYTAPITNQGNEGSCTGHGAYAMKGSQERISGTFQQDPSRRMVYNDARQRGGYLNEEGAMMIDVMNALLEDGVCREQYWPYVAEGADKDDWPPPNPDALVDAKNWRIKSFADCMKDADGSPAADPTYNVQAAIYFDGKPVVVQGATDTGTPWTQSWMDAWYVGNMPIPSDDDALLGGHSWAIIGWKTASGKITFIAQNSWGKTNLMGGYFEFPAETLTCRNWEDAGGAEIYKTVDAESHICPDGQHYDTDLQECVDDGSSPEPANCEENYQSCVQAAMQIKDVWTMILSVVNCVVNYYMCALGLKYKVTSKRTMVTIGKKKKRKIVVTVTEV